MTFWPPSPRRPANQCARATRRCSPPGAARRRGSTGEEPRTRAKARNHRVRSSFRCRRETNRTRAGRNPTDSPTRKPTRPPSYRRKRRFSRCRRRSGRRVPARTSSSKSSVSSRLPRRWARRRSAAGTTTTKKERSRRRRQTNAATAPEWTRARVRRRARPPQAALRARSCSRFPRSRLSLCGAPRFPRRARARRASRTTADRRCVRGCPLKRPPWTR
mmetsp:Transcript_4439/g.18927  ORF Transcript_4439/g.18927 Transcript_4439/m.18927 type:complete len:218 (+) Transcript_4439:687-1340(+)